MDIIKTKEFILRPYCRADAKSIAPLLNNWNVVKNLSQLPFPYEVKHAQQFISKMTLQMKKKEPKNYAMAIEVNGEVIGSIGLHNIVVGHKAEMGYWLAENYWGKGIMTEAVRLMTKYAFRELKLRRVYAHVYLFNEGSKRVLEKAGYEMEGISRKESKKKDKYIDAYILAKVK